MNELSDRIIVLGEVAFEDVALAIELQELVRDPDRGTLGAGTPTFASWSGIEGDSREVDFQRRDSMAWLAVRGEGSEELTEALAFKLGALHLKTTESGWATMMKRPRRSGGSAHDNTHGWHMLQAAITSYNDGNSTLVRSLIRAGLSDPDWRVRMTAVLAIGRLRLADLAPLAMKAEVPQAGKTAVSQQDRRLLLALRQAAYDFGLGLPPSSGPGDGKDEAVAALRRSFQEELHSLLSGDPRGNRSVAAALVAELLG